MALSKLYHNGARLVFCWMVVVCCLVAAAVAEPDLRAPDEFSVLFQTTVALNSNDDYIPDTSNSPSGSLVMYVRREWSPNGVDRFYTLLQPENAFYNDNGFFRVVEDFVVQVWCPHRLPRLSTASDDVPVGHQRRPRSQRRVGRPYSR